MDGCRPSQLSMILSIVSSSRKRIEIELETSHPVPELREDPSQPFYILLNITYKRFTKFS